MSDTQLSAIKHHLTDAMLMGYSAGTLPEAFSLLVASHITMCDECRARMETFDAVGGALLEQTEAPSEAMSAGSFASSLALIAALDDALMDDATRDATRVDKPAPAKSSILPSPLCDYVGGGLEAVKWRPIGMGVKQAILPTGDGATARLLYIPAGAAMPHHSHHGTEMTLVLKGAFEDEEDHFARGDVEMADSDLHHTPVADIHEDCICLAVTDAPLKFKGIIPRIAQKFIGI